MKKVYKYILRILCAIGCVYQMFNLNVIYFSYKTTTNVRYETQSNTYLPAITLCYHKSNQIKEEFFHQFSKISEAERSFYDSTIKGQFEVLKNAPSKLNGCYVPKWINGQYRSLPCSTIANFTQYIDSFSYCFTSVPQLNGESDEEYQVFEDSDHLIQINLNKSGNNFVFAFLHPRTMVFYQQNPKFATLIDLVNYDSCDITYDEIILKYMFKPFRECFVAQNRIECISKCIIDQIVDKTGEYPNRYLTNSGNSSLKFGTKYYSMLNLTLLEKSCQRLCELKTECYKQYFVTHTKCSKHERTYSHFNLNLEYPLHPTTIYEINLKMSFEEYLCLMSSVFSLWFGFSVIMFFDLLPLLFVKFKLNFKQLINVFKTQNIEINIKPTIINRPRVFSASRKFLH